jgi:hypothetical protein
MSGDVRGELAEALGDLLTAAGAEQVADALLPVVERIAREAAAEALRDAAAEMPTERQRHEVRQWLHERADAAAGGHQ